jgi:hypothetical protein
MYEPSVSIATCALMMEAVYSSETLLIYQAILSYKPRRLQYKLAPRRKHVNIRKCKVAAHAMKACKGSRGIAPLILNLGAGWW